MRLLLVENEFVRVTFEEGLFCFETLRPFDFDEAKAWLWINLIHDLRAQLGRPYAQLTRVQHMVKQNAGGTKVLRAAGQKEYVVGHALITPSRPIQLLVKFIMVLSPRTIYEEKTFVQEADARGWLVEKQSISSYRSVTIEEARKLVLAWDPRPRPENYLGLD